MAENSKPEDFENAKKTLKKKKAKKSKKKTISKPTSPILKTLKYSERKKRLNYSVANIDENLNFYFKQRTVESITKNQAKQDQKILTKYNDDLKKRKSKKKMNFIYFALNILVIAIVLAIQLSKEDDPTESIASILNINWWYILAAFATFAVCMFIDQIRYSCLLRKTTGHFKFGLAYKVAALGRYYDTITPLATGGQPFQVLYMNRYGVNAGEGTAIAMAKYIFGQIVYFVLITIVLFNNLFTNGLSDQIGTVSGGLATTLSWIGYVICFIVIFVVLLVTLNRRLGAGFVVGILKLCSKIKIGKYTLIKDYKKSFTKVMRSVNSWQSTTKKYSKSFWVITINIVASVVYYLVFYSMPFFIYCAFESWHPEMFTKILTIAIMVDLSSAFNPIPMGTGTADLSFTALYGMLFGGGAQVWALLIWRFLFYYIYILQGLFVVSYDYFVGNKKLEKYKEVWNMPFRDRLKYYREEHKNKRKK